ncbi:methylated-DNA--[protein]-cysteine S-methyltransferase [Hyphomicrobium sp.]|uniref:methylated-DNA--[protein]-cysteine S-methyltransferase n=1 Tax=Hyphomicrobium sp. TaxID=82 RepID=UPI002FE31840
MSEHIRYAWGTSSLGDFFAAVSDVGVVAFEFAERREDVEIVLRARFRGAIVTEEPASLVDIVGKLAGVVEHPAQDPGLTLDVRGTDYQLRVWDALRSIRAGETVTYGTIAAAMGTPRDARDVTAAIAANTIAILIPCHRVVKKDGSVSGYRWGVKRKRTLLSREQSGAAFKLTEAA